MAVTNAAAMTITEPLPDPAQTGGGYNPLADELVIRFAGTTGQRSFVVPIPAADDLESNVLSADKTGAAVGVQIDNLLFRAVVAHPTWRVLAEPNPPTEVVADLLAEVKRRFDRYGAGEIPPMG